MRARGGSKSISASPGRDSARHEQALQILVLDHLCEIQARQLYLTSGYGSLFDYTSIRPICKYCNALLAVPICRYCFRDPLMVRSSLIRFGLAP